MAGNQIKSDCYYRATMMKDLGEFIKKYINQLEIIIVGDVNEAIDRKQIDQFLTEHALLDVHS